VNYFISFIYFILLDLFAFLLLHIRALQAEAAVASAAASPSPVRPRCCGGARVI
jgi:hypothetical protein